MRKSIDELLSFYEAIQLDIACGENKSPGFIGIDVRDLPGVDIVWDLEKYPYPLPDSCVNRSIASHYVEHINPAGFGMIKFMNEIWRVMQYDCQFAILLPYGGSPRYWQDPTHINGCNENTFRYFDPIIDGQASELYYIYKPKPWKITSLRYDPLGDIEVLMTKRRDDASYE
jgi:hypothetical protein